MSKKRPRAPVEPYVPRAFVDDVRASFGRLLDDHGFRTVATEVSESFDNALVIAESNDIRLRVVRDRGEVYAELAPIHEPDDWCSVNLVRSMITGTDEAALATVAELAAFLDKHYSEIVEAFRPAALPQTNQRLEQLAQTRFEKILPESARTRNRS